MKALTLEEEILSGKVAPIYLLYGEETFWHRHLVELLSKRFTGGVETLDGDELSWPDLRDVVAQPSFFGPKLWVVRNAQTMFSAKEETFIQSIAPGSCVFMSATSKENPAPKIFLEMVAKLEGRVAEASSPSFSDAMNWVTEKLTGAGYKVSRDAVETLVLIAGKSMERLNREVEKIQLYVGPAHEPGGRMVKQITPSVVLSCVSPDPEMHTFAFTDAICSKNTARALKELEDLKARGTNPILIVAMLTSSFALLWRAKECSLKGIPQNSLAGVLGVHPFSAKKALEQSKNWTFGELERAFRLLLDVDESLKKGYLDPDLGMDYLVMNLTRS